MTTMDARTGGTDLAGRTTVVVGASRGLGRGIARAFAGAGAPVIAVARRGPAWTCRARRWRTAWTGSGRLG